jgi:hypothetical protein
VRRRSRLGVGAPLPARISGPFADEMMALEGVVECLLCGREPG